MYSEHIPSHSELINKYSHDKKYYESKFQQTAGIILILVITFIIVRLAYSQNHPYF